MSLVMTSGPALEPVSLAEAKAHLRLDDVAEDALLQSLIVTSRLHIEAALGLFFQQPEQLRLQSGITGRVLRQVFAVEDRGRAVMQKRFHPIRIARGALRFSYEVRRGGIGPRLPPARGVVSLRP